MIMPLSPVVQDILLTILKSLLQSQKNQSISSTTSLLAGDFFLGGHHIFNFSNFSLQLLNSNLITGDVRGRGTLVCNNEISTIIQGISPFIKFNHRILVAETRTGTTGATTWTWYNLSRRNSTDKLKRLRSILD